MPKKFSLKPIETELKQIRAALEKEIPTATPAKKKKLLKGQHKKMTKLILELKKVCKGYDVGG